MPEVTVLTAVHDGERYLAQTVESILAQTIDDWEYVIVDDASIDGTPAILERFAAMDPRIRVVRRAESGGPYAAANTGLAEAGGRYVVRLDADDLAPPDRLAKQVAFLDADPARRACLGSWHWMDPDGAVDASVGHVHTTNPRVLRWSICVVAGFVHSTACIEREALAELGGYAELPTSADLRLWCALARRGELAIMRDVVAAYRRHPHQISAKRFEVQRCWSSLVIQEHLELLTGESWDIDDADALRSTGRWESAPFDRGLEVLRRWERSWRADPDLRPADRRELRTLASRVRLRHARHNAGGPTEFLRGALSAVRWHG